MIPVGWLECNGQAVSRTTYAELFELIGTTYGVGDGSTTFNLPTETSVYDITNFTVIIKAYSDKSSVAVAATTLTVGDGIVQRKQNEIDITVSSGFSMLHEDMKVKAGTTLTVESDANVSSFDNLTNSGTIDNSGTITIR